MSWLTFPFCCLMILAPQMFFTNGIPMFVSESQQHLGDMCSDFVTFCACGASDLQYISVTVKMCPNIGFTTKNSTCGPCNDSLLQYDVCEKYEHCATCSLESCRSCPQGQTGKFCTENAENNELLPNITSKTSFPRKFHIPKGDPNGHRRILREKTGCDMPKLETAEVMCIQYDYKVYCHQQCIWGYRLPDELENRSSECTYRSKIWDPVDFEECYRYVNCDVALVSDSKLDCTVNQTGSPDECLISCSTFDEDDGGDVPESLYICDTWGNYFPELPYCAELNRTIFHDVNWMKNDIFGDYR